MILLHRAVSADFRANVRAVQDFTVVQTLGFPVVDRATHLELINTANHLIDRPEAELSHQFAQLFSNIRHEINNSIGAALELLTKL